MHNNGCGGTIDCGPCADGDLDIESDEETIPPPVFISITAGTFWMGSPNGSCPGEFPGSCINEPGRGTDEELHEVTLTYNYDMQAYEITQAEWFSLMSWNPSYYPTCDGGDGSSCPVENISWFDTLAYANELSVQLGLTACFIFSDVECEDASTHNSDYMACMNSIQGGIGRATMRLGGRAEKRQD